jgi:hypothetical protein
MHNENNTKILCKYLGGSHLYRLNTESSDLDERGIFITTDPSYIIGLKRHDEERNQKDGKDLVLKEFSNFIRLLHRGNTEAFETLFAEEASFSEMTKEFKLIRIHASELIDSEKLFNCLRGYAQGEYRLAMGERTGVLGSKRKTALDKYGFSPKNCTNLLRLLHTGIHFFEHDKYVVNCHDFGEEIYNKLFAIKTKPETYSKEQMTQDFCALDMKLIDAFQNRKVTHKFNEIIANWLIVEMYFPYLEAYYNNKQ